MLQDHRYWATASRGVLVYIPAFAGIKLYSLVTEAHWCEQLAQCCYSTVQQKGIELVTTVLLV